MNMTTEPAASVPRRRGAVGRVREYVRRFRVAADSELAELGNELNPAWGLALVSVGAALVLVLVLHVVTAFLLGAGSVVLQTLALVPVGALAIALVAVLIWAYRRTRRESSETSPYAIGLLASVVTIGVAAQAFAAVNVYLAERGVVAAEPPTLLTAESVYLWHLLDAVPFLDVTQTLGWDEPNSLRDTRSGTLLLAFKLAVIAPFIRLVLSSYHLLEKLRAGGAEEGARLERFVVRRTQITAGWATIVFVLSVPAVAGFYLGCAFAFDGESKPNRWLSEHVPAHLDLPAFRLPLPGADRIDDRLPERLDVPSLTVPVSWADTAPQWVLTALLLLPVAAVFVLALRTDVRAAGGDRWRMAGPLGAYLCLVAVVTALWASLTLTLLHSELVTARGAADGEFGSTTAYYLWYAADVVPAVDLPQTLHWSLGYEYSGTASGALLLAYKLAFLLILAFPLMRVWRSREPAAAAAHRGRVEFASANQFGATLRQAERELDHAAALARALLVRRRGRATPAKLGAAGDAAAAAAKRARQLEAEVALLGPEASRLDAAATAAAAAAMHRAATIRRIVESTRAGRHVDRATAARRVDETASRLAAAARSYRATALRVLADGAISR
jgi:hypothetical protein